MKKNNTLIATILAAGLMAGCASGPDNTAKTFGNSVRGVNQMQTLDPVAARNPDMSPVGTTDGERIENVLDNYRQDVSRRVPNINTADGAILEPTN